MKFHQEQEYNIPIKQHEINQFQYHLHIVNKIVSY